MEIRKFSPQSQSTAEFPKKSQMVSNSGQIVNPVKLNEKAISILTDRIKDEYTTHYFYRSAANWCKNVNYKKAADSNDKFQLLYFEETYF